MTDFGKGFDEGWDGTHPAPHALTTADYDRGYICGARAARWAGEPDFTRAHPADLTPAR